MIVQQYRLERGWSQEQLAEISGLNVRTIQRIESGQPARLETYKALGAAFDVDFTLLQENAVSEIARDPERIDIALAFARVRKIRGFYGHAMSYVLVNSGLVLLNLLATPHEFWAIFPIIGWGIGLLSHGLRAFDLVPWFGAEWERREVEKRLGRKLSPSEPIPYQGGRLRDR